jgi:hypothetical protein
LSDELEIVREQIKRALMKGAGDAAPRRALCQPGQ